MKQSRVALQIISKINLVIDDPLEIINRGIKNPLPKYNVAIL